MPGSQEENSVGMKEPSGWGGRYLYICILVFPPSLCTLAPSASLAIPHLPELLLELWPLAKAISLILSPEEPLPGPHLGQVSVHGPGTSDEGIRDTSN